MLIADKNKVMVHTFREGNKLANFFTNQVFFFTGSQRLTYTYIQDIPYEARGIINMDKAQLPNLKIRTYQNSQNNNTKDTKTSKQVQC